MRDYKRRIRADAIEQNKAAGCVCPGLKVSVKQDDDGFTVLSEGHDATCKAVLRGVDVQAPDAATQEASPEMTVVESKLWTP